MWSRIQRWNKCICLVWLRLITVIISECVCHYWFWKSVGNQPVLHSVASAYETQKAVTQQGFQAEDWLRHSDWLKSCEEQKVVTQQGFQAEDWLRHSDWLKCCVSGGQEASVAVLHGSYSSVAPASPRPAWPSLDQICCRFLPPRQPLKEPSHIQSVSHLPRQESASQKRQASLFKALTDLGQVPVSGSKYADCCCYINTWLLLLLDKHLLIVCYCINTCCWLLLWYKHLLIVII